MYELVVAWNAGLEDLSARFVGGFSRTKPYGHVLVHPGAAGPAGARRRAQLTLERAVAAGIPSVWLADVEAYGQNPDHRIDYDRWWHWNEAIGLDLGVKIPQDLTQWVEFSLCETGRVGQRGR